jgi:cell wall-associated NlpC family hydrolase
MPTGKDLLDTAKKLGARSEYRTGGTGEDLNKNGIPEYDCSELVMRALWELGYTNAPRLNSSGITKSSLFYEVSPENAQVGDITVFRTSPGQGHVGIVEWYDPSTGVGKFYGR